MVSAQALARGVTSSATGDAQLGRRQIKITAGCVSEPAVGQGHLGAGCALASPRRAKLRDREADVWIQLSEQVVELGER